MGGNQLVITRVDILGVEVSAINQDMAIEVINDGKPRVIEYGVTNEMAWEVGLACGGRIQLFVEPVE